MTDTYTFLGQYTLGECIPLGASAVGVAQASLDVSLPEVEAKLAGALEVQAAVVLDPPTIEAQIETLLAAVANLEASIALPGVSVDVSAMAAAVAELEASLGALQAQASIVGALSLTLGAPGVYALHYLGSPEGVVPGGIPGVSGAVEGVILLGADAGAIEAIRAACKVE